MIFILLLLGIEVGEFLLVPVPDGDARSLHRWRQELFSMVKGSGVRKMFFA